MARTAEAGIAPLGELLRYWRRLRGVSQLELSLRVGFSQRHLSFVESGRSAASRELVLTVSRLLDVPLRDRNLLLLAAGFAPMYREEPLGGPAVAVVNSAVDRLLEQQEPHPALVLDRYWNVLRTNTAAPRVFGQFVDLARWAKPRNLLRLMFSPDGLRPCVENWDDVAASLLDRVYREAVGGVVDAEMERLLGELQRLSGKAESPLVAGGASGAVVPIVFAKNGVRQSYFSLVAALGAPAMVATEELRVELMFPAD